MPRPSYVSCLQDDPTLKRALSYKFLLPPDALERGTARQHNLTRLRRALRPALKGEPVNMVMIGGSVTAGTGAMEVGAPGFVNVFFDFVNSAFLPTGGRTNILNDPITGSTSVVLDTCADVRIPKDAAVYIIELAINDVLPQDACDLRPRGNARAEFIARSYDYGTRMPYRLAPCTCAQTCGSTSIAPRTSAYCAGC